jgi:hypothetical protein
MWAEDGMVFMEDQQQGDFYALTCKEARQKLSAFAGEMQVYDRQRVDADPKTRAYGITFYHIMRGLVEALRDTIDDATRQGDPSVEIVRQQKMRVFLRSKQACSITGSGNATQEYNALFNVTPEPIIFQPGAQWFTGPREMRGQK